MVAREKAMAVSQTVCSSAVAPTDKPCPKRYCSNYVVLLAVPPSRWLQCAHLLISSSEVPSIWYGSHRPAQHLIADCMFATRACFCSYR